MEVRATLTALLLLGASGCSSPPCGLHALKPEVCANQMPCAVDGDCASGVCTERRCVEPSDFAPGVIYPYDPQMLGPLGLTAADLDGDGRLDLAVFAFSSDSSGSAVGMAILSGRGDGTFAEQRFTPIAKWAWGVPVLVADFDRDGRADLASPAAWGNEICVAFGGGDGSWPRSACYPIGPAPRDVAMADFDGDGALDLVSANTAAEFLSFEPGKGAGVSVVMGAGDGTFQPPRTLYQGTRPQAIATGDLDGDGHPDLVVAEDGNTQSILNDAPEVDPVLLTLLGAGDGTFLPARRFFPKIHHTSLRTRDIDGDGRVDVIAGGTVDRTPVIDVLLGDGKGGFSARRSALTAFDAGHGELAVADFDRDGHDDVATTSPGIGRVSIFYGRGDGSLREHHSFEACQLAADPKKRASTWLAAGDFNGDGRTDLATIDPEHSAICVILAGG